MSKLTWIVCFLIAGCMATLYSCADVKSKNTKEEKTVKTAVPDSAQLVARGDYLVNAMGCDDCHSPKQMGPQGPEVIADLRFSGYPADRPQPEPNKEALKQGWILFGMDGTSNVGPWGKVYSANISSDATGIGSWKEEQFIKAMRTGKVKGIESERMMLPLMPWNVYKNLTDEDLKAIFAYLKSSKPVKNIPPQPVPPTQL